jgi:hypothetical protein
MILVFSWLVLASAMIFLRMALSALGQVRTAGFVYLIEFCELMKPFAVFFEHVNAEYFLSEILIGGNAPPKSAFDTSSLYF